MNRSTTLPLRRGDTILAARNLTLLRSPGPPHPPYQTFEDDFRKRWTPVGKLPFLTPVMFVQMIAPDQHGPRCSFALALACSEVPAGAEFVGHLHHFDARMPYSLQPKHAGHEPGWTTEMTRLGY